MPGYTWAIYLIVPLVLGLFLWQRRRMAGAMAANTDKTVGAVAARLGLSVLEGDPNLNLLYFQQPSGDFKRTISAKGAPYQRNVALTIIDGQKTSEFIVARKITTSFGCFLEAELQLSVPAFELSLRQPPQYLEPHLEFAERPELSAVSCGDPQLDGLFLIRAADARVAAALVPALKLLSTQNTVHLAGEGPRVWMSFTRVGLPMMSYAPEEFLLALVTAACGLEGRSAPARLGAAAAAMPQHASA